MRAVALSPFGEWISACAPFPRKLLDDPIHPAALLEIVEGLLQVGETFGLTVGSGEGLFPTTKAIVTPRGALLTQRHAIVVGQGFDEGLFDSLEQSQVDLAPAEFGHIVKCEVEQLAHV